MKTNLFKILLNVKLLICFIVVFLYPDYCLSESKNIFNTEKLKKIHVLVIFTKFKGEAPGDTLAPYWASELFSGNPGSISHYFDEISFGQFDISGECLPKKYELPGVSDSYSDSLTRYSIDVLDTVDRDIDFAKYDNDGPDGIPGSNDDDGEVDYLMFVPMSRPYNFISGNATGLCDLGFPYPYDTNDKTLNGSKVIVNSSSGIVAVGQNYTQMVGLFCHEFIHEFDVNDSYDGKYLGNDDDSAGTGYWDIMGRGNLGWGDQNGPNPPCAYTRLILGFIGTHNSNLVELKGYNKDVHISDAGLQNGKIYRIRVSDMEYFLIEYRRNDGIYYDRNIPKNGLLIWHINENASTNTDEHNKRCDLECADGMYQDNGFPLGVIPDPINGGDNLDFWAHDSEYAFAHKGNNGDSTDVFDGVNYTYFGPDTNPNTNSAVTGNPTGIKIFNIHNDGDKMVFDVIAPPFTGWLSGNTPPIGAGYQRYANESDSLNSEGSFKENLKIIGNYPNPFNSSTMIKYSLKMKGETSFDLFNIAGQKINGKYLGILEPGVHTLNYSAGDLPSGVYFYRINSGKENFFGKFEIIR